MVSENQSAGSRPVAPNRSYGAPRTSAPRPEAAAPPPAQPQAPPMGAAPYPPPVPTDRGVPTGPPPARSAPGIERTTSTGKRPGAAAKSLLNSARPSSSGSATGSNATRTRKARLRLSQIDPWSVMKVSFVLSIALAIVLVVAVAVLWMILDSLGVFSSLQQTVGSIAGSGSDGFDISSYVSFTHVIGFSLLIALIDIVLITALSTLAAYLYNVACGFVGGLELTLAEEN